MKAEISPEAEILCPKCSSSDLDAVEGWLRCCNCENYFKPPSPEPPPVLPAPATPNSNSDDWFSSLLRRNIRRQAEKFNIAALFCLYLGVVLLAGSFGAVIFFQIDALLGFIGAGSLIGVAFWLFLIAQIMHIRANTEK